VTPDQSRHARDAEDAHLLENCEHAELLAAYYPVVLQRCLLGVRSNAAEDVAQTVCLRLAGELCRGKTYGVPYRVVVHKCIDWTIKGYLADLPADVPIPADWDLESSQDPFAAFEDDYDLHELFRGLPEGDREIAELRYCDSLEIGQIAAQLGKKRNAVYQALSRAHRELRKRLIGA
jgi:RNA polymerase sigma factor (sigma-70 family)